MPPFKSLKELFIYFSDETVCRKYLEQLLWEGEPFCPHCGFKKPYTLKGGKRYRCRNSTCKTSFSVTVGTVMENTKIPLSTWFGAIYLLSSDKKGVSAVQLGRQLAISAKSAWFLMHRIRDMFRSKNLSFFKGVVEVDETYCGGKDKNKDKFKRIQMVHYGQKSDEKTPVFGMIANKKTAFLRVVQDAKAETLIPIINEKVQKGSMVVSDAAYVYDALLIDDYGRRVVNHSKWQYVTPDNFTTNTVEGLFSILKRMLYGRYHWVSKKYLQRYCDECTFRYNTIWMNDNERFVMALKQSHGRLKFKQLTGENNNLAA